jgi:hypothetical protein
VRRKRRCILGGIVVVLVLVIVAVLAAPFYMCCVDTEEDFVRRGVYYAASDIYTWPLVYPDAPNGWEARLPPHVIVVDRGSDGWPVTLADETLPDYTCVVQKPDEESGREIHCGWKEPRR